jgi:hypothetical protein
LAGLVGAGANEILARRRRYSDTVTRSRRALDRISRASRSVTLNVSVAIGNTVILVSRAVNSGAQLQRTAAARHHEPGAQQDHARVRLGLHRLRLCPKGGWASAVTAGNREMASALGRALRLVVGEMADALILNGQRVLPRVAQERGFAFRYTRVDKALGEIYRLEA